MNQQREYKKYKTFLLSLLSIQYFFHLKLMHPLESSSMYYKTEIDDHQHSGESIGSKRLNGNESRSEVAAVTMAKVRSPRRRC